jgi:hypothetical protein
MQVSTSGGVALWRSTNKAASWVAATLPPGTFRELFFAGGRFYVLTTSGLYYSTNAGASWMQDVAFTYDAAMLGGNNQMLDLAGGVILHFQDIGSYVLKSGATTWQFVPETKNCQLVTDGDSVLAVPSPVVASAYITRVYTSRDGIDYTVIDVNGGRFHFNFSALGAIMADGQLATYVAATQYYRAWNAYSYNPATEFPVPKLDGDFSIRAA